MLENTGVKITPVNFSASSTSVGPNAGEPLFQPELLKRFDINGPRYTSYPTADRFHGDFSQQDYIETLS